ncbi:hypothetical protein CEXT_40981 [Caerostris extrusa]|uniref:Uncharacterized protein n=1 Tax=Caerostris extrusa TaxID=172846 RepID=A0AAV4QDT2_CAEEX|nr:hypothetical protein CEXT_40981 [Caerostris extrusa]
MHCCSATGQMSGTCLLSLLKIMLKRQQPCPPSHPRAAEIKRQDLVQQSQERFDATFRYLVSLIELRKEMLLLLKDAVEFKS